MAQDTAYQSEHEMLRETARKFAKVEIEPRREAWEEAAHSGRELFQKAAQYGLLCPTLLEAYGGASADFLYAAVIAEELAFHSHFGVPLSLHSEFVAGTIAKRASEETKQALLPGMAGGSVIGAASIAPFAASSIEAVEAEGGFKLSGQERYVLNGGGDVALLRARLTPSGAPRRILVDLNSAGVSREAPIAKSGLKGWDLRAVCLDQVFVSAACILDEAEDDEFSARMQLLLALSSMSSAERCLGEAVAYAAERVAFGRPILEFQNTRFVLGDLKAKTIVGRSTANSLLADYAAGEARREDIFAFRRWAGGMALDVADGAVQLFGGYGFMWEYPVARAYADTHAMHSVLPLAPKPSASSELGPKLRATGRREFVTHEGSSDWRRTPELKAFAQRVDDFATDAVVPKLPAWEAAHGFDHTLFDLAGDARLLCPTVPETYGGLGLDRRASVLMQTKLAGYSALSLALAMHSDIVAPYLLNFGNEQQKQRWLPSMATGQVVGALGMTEPSAGSDVKMLRTAAIRDGDHYVLSGSKIFISNGSVADLIIVAAKTDPSAGAKGVSLFLVDTSLPGFKAGRRLHKVGLRSADTAEIFFDEMRIPADCLLGEEGRGFAYMMAELPWERLQIAINSSSVARLAFDHFVAEGGEVESDLEAELRTGERFCERCVDLLVAGRLDEVTATAAKLWCSELHGKIVRRCSQGGDGLAGFDWSNPLSRAFVDARAQRIYGGANEIMKELIARTLKPSALA